MILVRRDYRNTMKKPPTVAYLQHLFKEEQFDELIAVAGTILYEEPENVRALYWRACAYMRTSGIEAALFDLDHAIDIYDEYSDAYSQRGVLHFHRGDLMKALTDMNKAVGLEPKNSFRYSSRAYIKSMMEDLEGAIEDYNKAIELDPEDAVAHNNLGLLQEKLGYKTMAESNMAKADRMMVNNEGELVAEIGEAPKLPIDNKPKRQSSYYKIIKDIFTTKDGLIGYWNFMKGLISGKKSREDI